MFPIFPKSSSSSGSSVGDNFWGDDFLGLGINEHGFAKKNVVATSSNEIVYGNVSAFYSSGPW